MMTTPDETAHIQERYLVTCVRCGTVLEFEATTADRKQGWSDKADLLRCAHNWSFFRISGAAPRHGWLCPACAGEVTACLEHEG